MSACVARETSTEYMIKVDPPFTPKSGLYIGMEINALNVWVHRPGEPWSYKVWVDDLTTTFPGLVASVLRRTKASLEHTFPGLFDAVVIPVMSDPATNLQGQPW